jgi:hypothetical protein
MSEYFKIADKKVRVSDHEPNYSLDFLRGEAVCFYTQDACGSKLSVVSQIESYCEKNGIDPSTFRKVYEKYPDQVYQAPEIRREKISKETLEAYRAIQGKKSEKKKASFCAQNGLDWFYMSQGYFDVV